MTLTQNFFCLFGLPESFDVDQQALSRAYRAKQAEHHPDKFVGAGSAERRQSAEQAAHINDAYSTLGDTVKRAKYLLKLQSGNAVKDNNLATEPDFLMLQIELRERIENFIDTGGNYDQLMQLIDDFQSNLDDLGEQFKRALAQQAWPQASILIAKMQLFAKLIAETEELEDSVQ